MNKTHISIIIPVYGCKTCLEDLYLRLVKSLGSITSDFEIILVDDASPDNPWQTIVDIANKDNRVKGIKLSRNFGQHYAITAGLKNSKGEWVVVMDCDLQDQPEEIPKLYHKAIEGFDIVFAKRNIRQDSYIKRMSSKFFHKTYSFLSGIQSDETIANFGIFNKKVIAQYNEMKESARSFPSLINLLGFTKTAVDIKHSERFEGKSSYTLSKLINLSSDVILANSNKPLKLTIRLGFIISFVSFVLAIYNVFAHYIGIIKVAGFTTTVFSIWFVGGLLMFVLGIVALYIGKIFDQVKERPLFIINKTVGFTDIQK